jgi:hypothetical protein
VPVTVLTTIIVFYDMLLCGSSVFCSTGCQASEDCSIDTLCENLKSYYMLFFLGGGGGGEGKI